VALTRAADLVGASRSEVAALVFRGETSPAVIRAAGERLAAADVALNQVLASYRSANPYGTKTEAELLQKTLEQLLEGRGAFGVLTGSPPRPCS